MPNVSLKTYLVLAAEDEESDAALLQLAYGRAGSPGNLVILGDGQNVIEYLNGDGVYADRVLHPFPSLLLLDLKMPRVTGFEVLAWLKKNPQFKDLPVVVLSSSSHESDIEKARQMGARDYHVKPHDLRQFVQLIKQLTAGASQAGIAR